VSIAFYMKASMPWCINGKLKCRALLILHLTTQTLWPSHKSDPLKSSQHQPMSWLFQICDLTWRATVCKHNSYTFIYTFNIVCWLDFLIIKLILLGLPLGEYLRLCFQTDCSSWSLNHFRCLLSLWSLTVNMSVHNKHVG